MRIGRFALERIIVPEGKKPPFVDTPHIWIQKFSGDAAGEGMSVKESVVEKFIEDFYKEHF